jgi:hypothetical protein
MALGTEPARSTPTGVVVSDQNPPTTASSATAPKTRRLARSRGALSGIMLVILGAWGALVPFIGPWFDFAFSPDKAWTWTAARGWYELLPGAVTFLAGLLLLFGTTRATTLLGAWLGILAGAWLVIGKPLTTELTLGSLGHPTGSTSGLRAVETLAYFSGLGALILFFAATAFGRLSVVTLRDVRVAERREAARIEAEELAERERTERAQAERDRIERETAERDRLDREHSTGAGAAGMGAAAAAARHDGHDGAANRGEDEAATVERAAAERNSANRQAAERHAAGAHTAELPQDSQGGYPQGGYQQGYQQGGYQQGGYQQGDAQQGAPYDQNAARAAEPAAQDQYGPSTHTVAPGAAQNPPGYTPPPPRG